jgi:hypothetical protein
LNLAPCSQTAGQKQGQKESELPWMSHGALLAQICVTDCDFLALTGTRDSVSAGHLKRERGKVSRRKRATLLCFLGVLSRVAPDRVAPDRVAPDRVAPDSVGST